MSRTLIFILLIMFLDGASALNCTDVGSDGIQDAIILIDTNSSKSNCFVDGSNDQIEINYAISNATAGQTVHLNDGTYNVNWSGASAQNGRYAINMKSNIVLEGNGKSTRIRLSNNHPVIVGYLSLITSSTDTLDNFTIQNLTLEGNWPNNPGFGIVSSKDMVGIRIPRGNSAKIKAVNIYNITTDGLWFSNYAGSGALIENTTVKYVGHDAIRPDSQTYITIRDSLGYATDENIYGNDGIRLTDVTNAYLYNVSGMGGGSCGLAIESASKSSDNITVIGGTYSSPWDSSICLTNTGTLSHKNVTLKNIIAHDSGWTYADDSSLRTNTINIYKTSNLIIDGLTLYGNNKNGIYISGNSNVRITNSIISYNGQYGVVNAGTGSVTINYSLITNNTAGNYNGVIVENNNLYNRDPLFVFTKKTSTIFDGSNNFHLQSQYYRSNGVGGWVQDKFTSPAINAADPTSDNSKSLWGGTKEMGAYGNTPEASKGEYGPLPPFDYFLSNSGNITINKGFGTGIITANLISGTTQPITFSIIGLPQNSSISLTGGNTCSPTCSKTITINTTNSTPIGTYPITVSATNGTLTKTRTFDLIVNPPSSYTNLVLTAINDTSIKSGEPNLDRSSKVWIDLGSLSGSTNGNYRSLLYFDLSAIPSYAQINTAVLTLSWEGENRNQNTVIGVYRPSSQWDALYATWNTRQNSVSWTSPGGDWMDKNGVSKGSTPYAEVTYPPSITTDANFNVASIIQGYVNGNYSNTGFFLKANELENTYISFHSSESVDANLRPKLVINYTTGSAPTNPAPSLVLFFPNNITQSQSLNNQSAFSITTDQVMSTDNWYIDGGLSASGSKNFAYTWTQAGLHNVTYSGSNANGSMGITWIVNVTAGSSPSDVNLDGVVNNADLVIVAQNFGEDTTITHQRYDVNTDGIVNILDLTIVANKII